MIALAMLVFVATATATAGAAVPAPQQNPKGQFLGVVKSAPASGRTTPRALAQSQAVAGDLTYHGGPVMHTNRTHVIYWEPSGFSTTASYKSLVDGFLINVAADSGRHSNVYATNVQYTDGSGIAAYSSTFAGSVVATDPYPVSGCTAVGTSVCLTDAQIRSEIDQVVTSNSLPRGLGDIYFVMTPPGVGGCFDATPSSACAYTDYCAYHSSFNLGSGRTLYANQPYADDPRCDSGQQPNGDVADSTINLISHEHNETITDPRGNAWFDSNGDENGDKCAWNFGTPLGATASGQYNELINNGTYYLQREWSNAPNTHGCVLTMPNLAPTASFTSTPSFPSPGQQVSFDGTASADSDGTVAGYAWSYGDGTTGAGATPSHTYATAGAYAVKLTVTDNDGSKTSVTHSVVVDAPPVAAFTFGPSNPGIGQAIFFDATGSSDPDGTVTAYSWDFGDGATAVGATPAPHAYASAGTYTVKLTVTDDNGKTAQTSNAVTVSTEQAPSAAFSFAPGSPTAGQPVTFDGSGSSDPDGTVTAYSWDFGDGSADTTTGAKPSHAYATPGTRTVALTVTDNSGSTATTKHDVVVTQSNGSAAAGGGPAAPGGAPPPGGKGSPTSGSPTGLSLGALPLIGARLDIPTQQLTFSSARRTSVVVRCGAGRRCAGTVAVSVTVPASGHRGSRVRVVVVGRARFSVAALHTATVRVQLSRLATTLLNGHRRIRVRATAAVTSAIIGRTYVTRSAWLAPAAKTKRR